MYSKPCTPSSLAASNFGGGNRIGSNAPPGVPVFCGTGSEEEEDEDDDEEEEEEEDDDETLQEERWPLLHLEKAWTGQCMRNRGRVEARPGGGGGVHQGG